MTDRELLTLAAKAAGFVLTWEGDNPPYPRAKQGHWNPSWNPLTSDGDALRLAVQLQLEVTHYGDVVTARKWDNSAGEHEQWTGLNGSDPYAATRRAIVRAAAEIARSVPGSPLGSGARPSEQDAPGSSIGLGAEGEQ